MAEPIRIRDDHGRLTPEGIKLAQKRMGEQVQKTAMLHAEITSLTLSIGFAASAGYADQALEAIQRDARDVVKRARELAEFAHKLSNEWRVQRVADEADRG